MRTQRVAYEMEQGIVEKGYQLSPKQLEAMSKYSAEIRKDFKTKTKKNKDSFSCMICGFSKSSYRSMKGHLSTHRPGNPFKCPIETCSKISPTRDKLTAHIKIHFPPKNPHRCSLLSCSATFRTRHCLISHKLTHSQVKNFPCNVPGCGKRFTLAGNLRNHAQVHLKPEERIQFKCPEPECGQLFKSRVGYYHHTQRHKGIFQEKKYTCFFCKSPMLTPSAREIHIRRHLKEKPFHCEQCGIWLSSEGDLRKHCKVHLRTDPFDCPHCPKQYTWRQDLRRHLKMTHNENATFQCIHCSYQTLRIKDLQKHEKTTHSEFKSHGTSLPLNSDIYGKCFITQPRLKYQVQSYSDENKFPCSKCDNKYKTNVAREMHLQHIHGLGDKHRDVQCYFCSKTYRGYSGYLKHFRIHSLEKPYKCTEPGCSKPWMTSQDKLVYHLQSKHGIGKPRVFRNDTDERFKCQKCPSTYKNKGDLTKHVQIIHDKTAPTHKCPEPGCAFKTLFKNYIRQHLRSVHFNISYKCKNCPKRYKTKRDLTKHSRICV